MSTINVRSYPLCSLLVVALASTLSHAQATSTLAETEPSSLNLSINENVAVRQELARIIISDDYATASESTQWEYIDKSDTDLNWLEKWLESIFGQSDDSERSDSEPIALLSLLLKILFVAALLAFIIWVLSRAGYLTGWAERLKAHNGRRSRIRNQEAGELTQGWEQLSAHEQIPAIVKALIQDNNYTEAASVLYRGSLRWLSSVQGLTITVADTEQQCLAQLQQLNDSSSHLFISQIIRLWLQMAYQESYITDSKSLSLPLQQLADQWLAQLPVSSATIALANVTDADNIQLRGR